MSKSKITILLTGAGTATALNVLKALRNQSEIKLKIISCDINPLSACLYFSDRYYIIPKVDNKDFIPTIKKICRKERVNIILPLFSREYEYFSDFKQEFIKVGVLLPISEKKTVAICSDKLLQIKFFIENNLPHPHTILDKSKINPLRKYIIKPRKSSGSKNIKIVKGKDINSIPKSFILQEFIDGTEFTVDCLLSQQSKLISYVIRERISVMDGKCVKGRTVNDLKIKNIILNLLQKISLKGLINIQIIKSNINHKIYLTEINPRPSAGGLPLSIKAGVNFPLLLLKDILGRKINKYETDYKPNIYMIRFFDEIFLKKMNNNFYLL
jgi:carbamoyl-phosphate synthase large subunit